MEFATGTYSLFCTILVV